MDFKEKSYDVFRMFNDRWALVTAGKIDNYNTMTIAWGSMGTIWGPPHKGKPILTVYVSPARYTHGYLDANEYFTVSFFPEEYRRDLLTLGSKSGRDGDKVALTQLTPVPIEHGVDFEQAELTFVCKKLYAHQFEKAHALVGDVEEDHRRAQYAARADDLHIEYVGDPHEQENQHLAADALEAHLAGELLVGDGAHDARDVVDCHERHKSDEQTVTAAEEVSEPSSDCRDDYLNGVPEFFHEICPPLRFWYEKSDCP